MISCAAAFTMPILFLFAYRRDRLEFPQRILWLVLPAFVPFGAAAAATSVARSPILWILLAGGNIAGLIVLLRTRANLPRSFQVAPVELEARASYAEERASSFGPWGLLLRCIFLGNGLFFAPTCAIGALSGQWLFTVVMLGFLTLTIRARTRWLAALPISPRALLWAMLLPAFMFILLAEGLVVGTKSLPKANHPTPNYGGHWSEGNTPSLKVPLEYWNAGPGAQIVAPWGEGAQPERLQAIITLHNPYSVGHTNSRRFLIWQYSRALTAAYGRSVTEEEAGNGRIFAGKVPSTWTPFLLQPRAMIALTGAVLGMILVFQFILGLLEWRRDSGGTQTWTPRNVAVGVIPLALIFADLYSEHLLPTPEMASSALINSLVRWLATAAPGGIWGVVAASFLLAGIPYLAVDWQFRRREVPRCAGKSAVNWFWTGES
jgi:hypothetical protein